MGYLFNVASQEFPPLVHSVSYGEPESYINGWPFYGKRCDLQFLVMGLRGLSVIFSAGDYGVGGSTIATDYKRNT